MCSFFNCINVFLSVNSSYTSRQGGCLFLCRHHFFYLPMPARKFLISWHITIFAVHGFCGDLVFLCSYPTMCRANFLFFTFTQKVFKYVTKFSFFLEHVTCYKIYFTTLHHNACIPWHVTGCGRCFSTRHIIGTVFLCTSLDVCVLSVCVTAGSILSDLIAESHFIAYFGCSLPSSQETESRFRQGTSRNIGWLTSRRYRSKNDSLTKNEDLLIISQ
jgi:hypothetical protein